LLALQLPERFLVRLFHHAPLGSRRPNAILDPNSAPARQEKPVNHLAEDALCAVVSSGLVVEMTTRSRLGVRRRCESQYGKPDRWLWM
jgi:hypothetical protein